MATIRDIIPNTLDRSWSRNTQRDLVVWPLLLPRWSVLSYPRSGWSYHLWFQIFNLGDSAITHGIGDLLSEDYKSALSLQLSQYRDHPSMKGVTR